MQQPLDVQVRVYVYSTYCMSCHIMAISWRSDHKTPLLLLLCHGDGNLRFSFVPNVRVTATPSFEPCTANLLGKGESLGKVNDVRTSRLIVFPVNSRDPTLLELVPPPSPFFAVLVFWPRTLPLRVPVLSRDCGDIHRASDYHHPCRRRHNPR